MPTGYIELRDVPVLRVKADMKGKGPPAAFKELESKLPTLKGRRFYGIFQSAPERAEEYWACVAMVEGDDPVALRLETGVIKGGWYPRRRVVNWEQVVREGRMPLMFDELAEKNSSNLDVSRASVEFYRSQDELIIMVPLARAPKSSSAQNA